jgi:hypothetical protein
MNFMSAILTAGIEGAAARKALALRLTLRPVTVAGCSGA